MSKNIHIATYQRVVHNGVTVAEHFKKDLPDFGKSVVIRLGGTRPYTDYEIQINSQQAVLNSVDKLKQKQLLLTAGLTTLPILKQPVYPCVVKAVQRSGGTSVFVVNNKAEFEAATVHMANYYIEPLFTSTGEYRLHCTQTECFFAVKKHKRNPADVIINRDNHYNTMEFTKPRLWNAIKAECVKAMKVLDLDIACFDVMYCSSNDAQHKFAISEANTNPELLHNTYNKYLAALIKLINDKIDRLPAYKKPVDIVKPSGKILLTDKQKLIATKAICNDTYWISDDGETLSIKL